MKRVNMELSDDEFAELEKAKSLFGASSYTEAIRRSLRLANKLIGREDGQIFVRNGKKEESLVIIT